MKYYGIRKKRNVNYIFYQYFKTKKKLDYLFELDKESKKRKKETYEYDFLDKFQFEESNQIPDGHFYEPSVIIVTDLVAKENISQLKQGINKIILKYSTKKFLGTFSNVNDINKYIDNLNENITDNQSWKNLGRFDFSNYPDLDKEIEYFDMKIINFSSSFVGIQFKIFISDERKRELIKLINDDYKGNSKKIISYYQRKKNKSGGRKRYTISTYSKNNAKNAKISEFITELKWRLFNKISKYIPTILHGLGEIPPSVNVFKTNITLEENERSQFLDSIGDPLMGLPVLDNSRLVLEPITDYMNNRIYLDYTYVVNIENKKENPYMSLENEIITELEYLYSKLIKTHILKVMSIKFTTVSSNYRNKVNNVKIKKKSYKKLLTLRYAYEKDINVFKRMFEEIDWAYEKKRLEDFSLEDKFKSESHYLYAYNTLTEYPFIIREEIEKYQNYIKREIENKLTLTSHLKDYKAEGRNHRLNIINISISTITFFSLLFPSIPMNLADKLRNIGSLIFNYLQL